jgi:hypothetical protein
MTVIFNRQQVFKVMVSKEWSGHAVRIGEMRNTYKILVRESKGRDQPGRL